MYKLIGGDGKEYGPVSAEQLRQWVREFRANAHSLVQPEGSTTWLPLGQLPEFADLFAAAPVAPPPAVPYEYHLNLGRYLSNGWLLFQQNMGLLLAVWVIYFAIHVAIGLVGIVPFMSIVGSVAQLILTGPLMGGVYWVYLQRRRNQPATAGDLFAGFQRAFGNLILVQLIPGFLCLACVIPGGLILLVGIILQAAGATGNADWSGAAMALVVAGTALSVAGVVVAIYLGVCWWFALPLVVDRQVGFWEAMRYSYAQVRQHWWGVFGCVLVLGLVAAAGTLACGVGLLLTIPWSFAAMVYLYEEILGRPAQAA